jgi:membrane protein
MPFFGGYIDVLTLTIGIKRSIFGMLLINFMKGIALKKVLKRVKNSFNSLALVLFIIRGFFKDNCFQVAAALTYTTLLALVPLAAILLSVLSRFETSQEAFQDYIFQYLIPTPSLQQIIVTNIQKIAAQTTTLSIFGGLFLIFTSVSLLNTIEGTFYNIWGVTERRSHLHKFTVFWSVITISPILIVMALLLSMKLTKTPVLGSILGTAAAKGLLVYFLPFFFTFVAFFFIYRVLPYTKVKVTAAFIGSLVATILFQVARWGFGIYVSKFANNFNKIYGILGTLPMFFLWVYICWVVVLLGAEITYTVQHIKITMKGGEFTTRQYDGFFGLRVMMAIGRSFLQGDGAASQGELAAKLAVSYGFLSHILKCLKRKGLVYAVDGRKEIYLPARALDRITAQEVMKAVHGDPFRIPSSSSQNRDNKVIQQLFHKAQKELEGSLKEITIGALLRGQG